MQAMLLTQVCDLRETNRPLELADVPVPVPNQEEILLKVLASGVCHTELDEIEGRTPPPRLPIVPGHQVVGRVAALGNGASRFEIGDRVGVAWIFSACGVCSFCRSGKENLCPDFKATGRDANGGYAQFMTVSQEFAHPIPDTFTDSEAAPLLCAGAVGYRSLGLADLQDGDRLGLTGFGAAGHLVLLSARHQYPNSDIFVFARSEKERRFAEELGAVWSGDSTDEPPELLDVIIDTTPVWKPVVEALARIKPGGRLIINAIRKEEIDKEYLLTLDYSQHLWMEKDVKSVANAVRKDVRDFLKLAAEIPLKPEFQEYALEDANTALLELKSRKIRGAKVLRID
ncbi:zinc-dependent alcohol dehydrogenase family protein [bacterium]|nr:zinc-dependent alcohol dehydrogenase family protein [bacterium]